MRTQLSQASTLRAASKTLNDVVLIESSRSHEHFAASECQ